MYRNFFRFAVMTVTILTANLLTNALADYLTTFRHHARPLAFTVIGMAITVVILYPLYTKLEEWVKKLSMKILHKGKSMAGKYLGMILAFILCLAVLAFFYAREWYGINLLKILFSGEIGYYI